MPAVMIAALGAGLGGLASAIATLFFHKRAERSLVEEIRKQEALRQQLEVIKASFDNAYPDPVELTRAQQLLTTAASQLNERQNKDIISTLEQGSDRSKANYIAKLLDEVAS
jgi:hypothetical protein